jgi:hypothetical protein
MILYMTKYFMIALALFSSATVRAEGVKEDIKILSPGSGETWKGDTVSTGDTGLQFEIKSSNDGSSRNGFLSYREPYPR